MIPALHFSFLSQWRMKPSQGSPEAFWAVCQSGGTIGDTENTRGFVPQFKPKCLTKSIKSKIKSLRRIALFFFFIYLRGVILRGREEGRGKVRGAKLRKERRAAPYLKRSRWWRILKPSSCPFIQSFVTCNVCLYQLLRPMWGPRCVLFICGPNFRTSYSVCS